MKKFLLLILCLVSSLMASAESGTCGANLTWELEDGVLTISGTGAMYNYSSESNAPWYSSRSTITLAIISEGVTSIGNSAFSGCSALTSITIPNSVTSIGNFAFFYCPGLTSVIIPNSVTSIGNFAFEYCYFLTSITIPNSVTSIGKEAFEYCRDLTSVRVLATTPPTCGSNLLRNAGTSTIHVYKGLADAYREASGWSSYTIVDDIPLPQYVISVSADESMGTVSGGGNYTQGTEVTLTATPAEGYRFVRWSDGSTENPYTFTATENKELVAYFGGVCGDNLTWTLEDGVLTISGTGAMTNYSSSSIAPWYSSRSTISLAIISEGVTSIGNYAFSGCTGLTSITIPNSVTSIGDYAFFWCSGLTSVTIPDGVTSIGSSAFSDCSGLTSITIPDGVTSIGSSAFFHCNGLTSVTIPNSVTSISGYAFYECSGLTSITIPNSVTRIGWYAFHYCSSLTSVRVLATTPPTCGSGILDYAGTSTIHVYEGLADAYRAASGWDSYNIVDDIPLPGSVTISVSADAEKGSVTGAGEYTEGDEVTLTAVPAKGYEFLNWSDGSTENPYVFTATEDKNLIADFYRFGPEEGKVYKIRLDESDLYFAMNPNEDFGNTDNVQSAAYLTDESNATLVRFTDSGEGYIITDIKNSRTLGVANSYVWNFNNTSSNVWTMEVVDGKLYIGGEIYSGSGHRYWKSDAQEINAYLYTNGSRRTIAWILEEYSIVSLTDGEEYARDIDEELDELTYTRTFNNTNWQAFYVPFQMSYEDWEDEFDVAQINNFHQYDTDNDDVFDTLEMEIIKVKNSTLKQNTPYLIRAKETGLHTITLPDATLYAAEENSCVCMSMSTIFTFTGTYTGVSGEEMYNRGYYSMGGGALIQAASTASGLKPYRWYLQMESRDGMVIPRPASVRVKVFGEDDLTTGVEYVDLGDSRDHGCFDLQGRVANSKSKGLYIINGKKVLR